MGDTVSMKMSVLAVILPCLLSLPTVTSVPDILYLIITQDGAHHQAMARRTEDFLLHQYQQMTEGQMMPDVFWSSRDLSSLSPWSIFTLSKLPSTYSNTVQSCLKWIPVLTSYPGT